MRKRKTWAWQPHAATLGLVLAVALSSFVSAAWAHTQANSGNVYDSGSQCVGNFTSRTHSRGDVQVTSTTNTPPWAFPTQQCTYSNSKPDGYLAARWELWKWGANVGAWVVCGTHGWSFGGGSSFSIGRTFTGCGPGYYGLQGAAFVYNGGWQGGWLWTGYEWLF